MSHAPGTGPAASPPPQLTLPRQSHTAQGPHDQTGMYVMHHSLRRDLERFVSAVEHTPVEEREVWTALQRRWRQVAELLHHHHTVEDESLWPVLRRHATEQHSTDDLRLLAAMEAEHEQLGPHLTACRETFATMTTHPSAEHRSALARHVRALRDGLLAHLAHEEREALPMLQRTLSAEENEAFEAAAQAGYPLRVVPFALCWVMDELPEEARRRILADTPPGYGLVLRVLRPGYQRRTRRAFRHAREVRHPGS